jgi:aminopeptidase YwaD
MSENNIKKIRLKTIKNIKLISILLFLTGVSLFLTTCTRDEDDEKLAKEAITITLNDDINADTLRSFVAWLQDMGTRFALADNHRYVAVQIKNRFIRLGYNNTKLDSFLINKTYKNINYQQYQYNIVATLETNTRSDSICIIGAHYDSILNTGDPFMIAPGANDNAGGVAAALEIARVMKKNNYIPKNTIKFIAFGSEELGLYGSYEYAASVRQAMQPVMFMLNNDMIAYEPDNDNAKWSVNILDYDNSHYLRKEAEQLCVRYSILSYYNDNTNNRLTDSYPFFNNDFKALCFTSNKMDPNYHSVNDLTSNCNFEYCKEIVKLNCTILVDKN